MCRFYICIYYNVHVHVKKHIFGEKGNVLKERREWVPSAKNIIGSSKIRNDFWCSFAIFIFDIAIAIKVY